VREEFQKNVSIAGSEVKESYEKGMDQLAMVKRISTVSGLYPDEKSVMQMSIDVTPRPAEK
jgi:hypothetical protein